MDENVHDDQLEPFFRKSFDNLGEGPSPDGWDTPGDEVWAGIDQELSDSAGAKRIFPWRKWALAACLLIGVLLMGHLMYTNHQLKKELSSQTSEIASLRDSLHQLHTAQQQEPKNQPLAPGPFDSQESTSTENPQSSQVNLLRTQDLSQHQSNGSAPPMVNKKLEAANIEQPIVPEGGAVTVNASEVTTATVTIESTNQTMDLPTPEHREIVFLPTLPGSLVLPYPRIHFLSSPQIKSTKDKRFDGLRFFAGAFIAPNFTGSSISRKGASEVLFRSTEAAQWSAERGLKFGVQLSDRWSLQTGVSLYNAKLRSHQIFRLEYNPEEETQVDDEYETIYALSVPSSYGTSDVELDVRRPAGQPIEAGRRLLVDINSAQQLKFVSIPLVAAYQLGTGRLNFSVKAGLALNILNTKTFSSTANVRLSALRLSQVRVQRSFEDTQTLTMDYLLGVQMAYNLNHHWSLALEPTFRRNITPITENEQFRTNNQAIGLQVGAYFRF